MNLPEEQVEVVSPLISNPEQSHVAGVTGEEQYFASRALFLHSNRKVDSGKVRHHYIRYEKVRSLRTCSGQGLQGVSKVPG